MSTTLINPSRLTLIEESSGVEMRSLYLPADGSRDYYVLSSIQDEMGAPRFAQVTNDLNEDAGYSEPSVIVHHNDDVAGALVALGCVALIGSLFVIAAVADASITRGNKKGAGKPKGGMKKKVAKKAKAAKKKIKSIFSRKK